MSVAWEMWLRGDFLVPYLNGAPYSHKPPLLFWLVHLGWWIFSVNEWWPRLVPSLFALGSVFLTVRIAAMLWPELPAAARTAPVILLGTLLWAIFTTLVFFGMLIGFSALLGVWGVLLAWPGKSGKGWLLTGLPWGWASSPKALWFCCLSFQQPRWRALVGGNGTAQLEVLVCRHGCRVADGGAIGLAWAIPAALWGRPRLRPRHLVGPGGRPHGGILRPPGGRGGTCRSWPLWLAELSPVPGLVLAAIGVAVIMIPWNNAARTATVLGLAVLHFGVLPAIISGFDMHAMSRFLTERQVKGDPISPTCASITASTGSWGAWNTPWR